MTLLKLGLVLIVIYIHSVWAEELKVASLNYAPYMIQTPDGGHEGYIVDLLDEMGLDYQIVSPADGKYGGFDQVQNKWNGVIGMVLDQKADAIGLDLTMTSQRFQVLDFTPPIMEARLTVMTKEV